LHGSLILLEGSDSCWTSLISHTVLLIHCTMYYCGSVSNHLGPSAFNKLNWIEVKTDDVCRAGKTNSSATQCSLKTKSRHPPNVRPEVLMTGSRRRHVVACLYVVLCALHGGPLLFTVFFSVVSAVVRDDTRQATITLHSFQVFLFIQVYYNMRSVKPLSLRSL